MVLKACTAGLESDAEKCLEWMRVGMKNNLRGKPTGAGSVETETNQIKSNFPNAAQRHTE